MIYHSAKEKDWLECQQNGLYGKFSIEKDGFIHCFTSKQLIDVANNNLKHINEKLVVLSIDTKLLKPELKWERNLKNGITFPHICGEINIDSVAGVTEFQKDESGNFVMPDKILKIKADDEHEKRL